MAVQKAVPVVLRNKHGRREVLAFRHPAAGLQIVKGTVEPGEQPEATAVRELAEESGLTGASLVRSLGSSDAIVYGETWHFFLLDAPEQPVRWIYASPDDGGQILHYFWHPLDTEPGDDWQPMFVRALDHVRAALASSP